MNAEILTCNTQFSFVLLCLVWFALVLMLCLRIAYKFNSRVYFSIIFLFEPQKQRRKKENGQLSMRDFQQFREFNNQVSK